MTTTTDRWRLAIALIAVCVLWSVLAAAAGAALLRAAGPDNFNLIRWELTRLPRKYVHAAGARLRDEPAAGRDAVPRYFAVENQVDNASAPSAGRGGMGSETGISARNPRPAAESVVERELARAVREQGLARRGMFLPGAGLVWPPVDVAFDDAPSVLVLSPRERVQLTGSRLLRPGLSESEMRRIEAAEEQRGQSAIVEPLSGFAAYPSVVTTSNGPRAAIITAAHEWVHHYLAFFPLGAAYQSSADARTINETVAGIAGRELGTRVIDRLMLPPAERPTPAVDTGAILRDLRREVDRLLAGGDIAGAERRMHEVRDELAARGQDYRRINQAFLAFHDLYADAPSATSPIGPRLQRLRALSPDLATFMHTVRDITTVTELSRLVDEAETRERR